MNFRTRTLKIENQTRKCNVSFARKECNSLI